VKKLNVSKNRKNKIEIVVRIEIVAIDLRILIAIFSLRRLDLVNSV
tara:strand:+ start:4391 stop:4528 length:138 start_codon:yes stop_codon:yes gene_type:complete